MLALPFDVRHDHMHRGRERQRWGRAAPGGAEGRVRQAGRTGRRRGSGRRPGTSRRWTSRFQPTKWTGRFRPANWTGRFHPAKTAGPVGSCGSAGRASGQLVAEPVDQSHAGTDELVEQLVVGRTGVRPGGCQFLVASTLPASSISSSCGIRLRSSGNCPVSSSCTWSASRVSSRRSAKLRAGHVDGLELLHGLFEFLVLLDVMLDRLLPVGQVLAHGRVDVHRPRGRSR